MKRPDHKLLGATCWVAGALLTSLNIQAMVPSLSYEINGSELVISYTGTLLQSSDAVNWTEVQSASSPYQVKIGSQKLFFCAQGDQGEPVVPFTLGDNITILLSDVASGDDNVSLDMIWIDPATFTMSSPEGELGRGGDEIQHQVTLSSGYWMGKYEVTQAQYEAVMGENPSLRFIGADLPVEAVTWENAKEFCAKLTEIEKAAGRLPQGYEYSLPTEAEWEYACRAGTTTALNSGKNLSRLDDCPEMDEVGWYWCNSNGTLHPVGQKQPNAWGLYDMHGNVYEWCLDWYGAYPTEAVTDPKGPRNGKERIMRGGSWDYSILANSCRSGFRFHSSPDFASDNFGFRVALSMNNLIITINDSKVYDGGPLVSGYTIATVTGLLPDDSLTAGEVTTKSADAGSYSYPDRSEITIPFNT
ncbi:MAG: formylglycine-generating enzyme family protein, partial [Verrucomicrobia bacterium]|nr:formylglycine-generating enzyme family protein [Verrucomicrobiota bacterium]